MDKSRPKTGAAGSHQLHYFPQFEVASGDTDSMTGNELENGASNTGADPKCADGITGRRQMSDGEASQARQQAFDDGYARGQQQCLLEKRRECQPLANLFNQLVVALDGMTAKMKAVSDRQTIELAITLAEQIIEGQVDRWPDMITAMVDKALRNVSDQKALTIRINPADLRVVETHLASLSGSMSAQHADIESDSSIRRGGCLVETEFGHIDARIEHQMEAIAQTLFNSLEEQQRQ